MSTEQTTQQQEPESSTSTKGNPQWYPEKYPEWLVTEGCLPVVGSYLTGASLSEIDGKLKAHLVATALYLPFVPESQKAVLIRCLALAAHPEMTEGEVACYLQGITDAYVSNHAYLLPRSRRFYEAYPRFKEMADSHDPERDLETANEFLGLLLKAEKASGEEE